MKLMIHPRDTQRIVLADDVETTVARTTNGMFPDSKNDEHAGGIIERWNAYERLVDLLRDELAWHETKASNIAFMARGGASFEELPPKDRAREHQERADRIREALK